MIPRSDRFDEGLLTDHVELFAAELWAFNEKQRDLEVTGGSYTIDGTADHLRRVSLVLSGDDLNIPGYTPNDGDNMWPTGSEIKLFAGIGYSDGTEELLQQGLYRISKPKVSEDNDGAISVSCDGYDLSEQVSRNRWISPQTIPDSTNLATAIASILTNRLPNKQLNFSKFSPTSFIVPETTLVHGGDSDPWKDCLDLATSGGMEIYFDHEGDPVLRDIRDNNTTPDMIYTEDQDCTLLNIERDLDEERGYSGVVVSAANPDNHPVLAVAWDTDPTSATFVDTFGYVPYFVNTQFLKDYNANPNTAQAQLIADSTLLQVKGIIEQVSFEATANFAHEQGDLLQIKRSTVKVNNILCILDGYTRGLEEGAPLSAVTRKRRVS